MPRHSSATTGKVPLTVLRAHLMMGALHLVAGLLVLALNVALAAAGGQALIGSGFWAGGFFLAAGALGVCVSRGGACGSRCCAAACLALSVLASGLAMGAIIGEAVLISANSGSHARRLRKKCRQNQDLRAYFGLSITCLIIFLFEFVLAIVHAAYGYRVCCSISQPHQPANAESEDQLPAAANFLIIETDDGQRILVPAAAMASAQLPAGGAVVLPLEQTGISALSNDLLPVAEPQPPYNPYFMNAQLPPPYEEAGDNF